jgi:hypothetical protein
MVPARRGYGPAMTENQPGRDPEIHVGEVPEGAQPTTNQPLNAEPRPRLAPAVVTILLVAAVVVIILALTML